MVLAGLSVNMVVARAGVAKGTFYVHFKDRSAFVDAMHERFHASVQEAMAKAIAGMPPGAERIYRSSEVYLDVSTGQSGRQGARAGDPLGPLRSSLDGHPP